MNRKQRNNLWINPLLTQLKLVRKTEETADPDTSWNQIELSHLPERVGKIAAEINEAAGYHLLEALYYLPPQKNVLCVRFDRNQDKHSMDIVVRENGIYLKFSTATFILLRWARYFSSDPRSKRWTLVWEQPINPGEISEEHIQGWLTYLLSEFQKEFRPDVFASTSTAVESELAAVLRKASA